MAQPDDSLTGLAARWASDEQLAAEQPDPAEAVMRRQNGDYTAPILREPDVDQPEAE